MSSALLFLSDGFEEVEALTVVDLLRRARIDIYTVSITDSLQVTGRSRITVTADKMWDEINPELADILILPGGMPGTTYLGKHEGLRKQLLKAASDGRMLAAICAAPSVFGELGLLEGKNACCYPGMETSLKGAEVVFDKKTVKDGKIITSRGAGTAISFALRIIHALEGEDVSDEIKKSIVYMD